MTEYKKFDEKMWADFGKSLLEEKGGDEQKKFLKACQSRETFLHYIDNHFSPDDVVGETAFEFPHKPSESEFINTPFSTQQIIWDEFDRVIDETKFSCGFWGMHSCKYDSG